MQGPEWLWLTGFYMRARLAFSQKQSDSSQVAKAVRECQEMVLRLDDTIRKSPWRSLPELTNANGEVRYLYTFFACYPYMFPNTS